MSTPSRLVEGRPLSGAVVTGGVVGCWRRTVGGGAAVVRSRLGRPRLEAGRVASAGGAGDAAGAGAGDGGAAGRSTTSTLNVAARSSSSAAWINSFPGRRPVARPCESIESSSSSKLVQVTFV